MVPFLKILAIIAFAALFLIIPTVVIIYIIRTARRTSVDRGLCRNCGYDLTGLHENRCPECGRRFVRDQEGLPFS